MNLNRFSFSFSQHGIVGNVLLSSYTISLSVCLSVCLSVSLSLSLSKACMTLVAVTYCKRFVWRAKMEKNVDHKMMCHVTTPTDQITDRLTRCHSCSHTNNSFLDAFTQQSAVSVLLRKIWQWARMCSQANRKPYMSFHSKRRSKAEGPPTITVTYY